MKLWLDDVRPMPSDYDVHARTADEAIALLSGGEVTHVSLDHDLGVVLKAASGPIAVVDRIDESAGSGYDVATWIETGAHEGWLRRLSWAVHSANPVGRQRMVAALRRADQYWRLRDE